MNSQGGSLRPPVAEELGAGHGLERDDDDPEVPVHPAGQEAGELAEREAAVLVEAADRRVGDRHLAEHAHHQHDQQCR